MNFHNDSACSLTKQFYRLGRSTLLTLGDWLIPEDQNQSFIRCLYAHHVFPEERARFARVLEELQGCGEFIDVDQLLALLNKKKPIDGRYFFLSFDDGFRNVIDHGLPILERFEIPAVLFVPTEYVGVTGRKARQFANRAGYNREIKFASWKQLREASSSRFEIGAHTRTHVRLSELNDRNELLEEINGAKRDLEQHLQTTCRLFSWPFGTTSDISEMALKEVKRAGFRVCFSAVRGDINPRTTDPFRIPREHFEPDWPLSHVRFFARGLYNSTPFARLNNE
jgi:peptidoglycan/xylan/chitin deacetylase (PgdA/CDA1 family)